MDQSSGHMVNLNNTHVNCSVPRDLMFIYIFLMSDTSLATLVTPVLEEIETCT